MLTKTTQSLYDELLISGIGGAQQDIQYLSGGIASALPWTILHDLSTQSSLGKPHFLVR